MTDDDLTSASLDDKKTFNFHANFCHQTQKLFCWTHKGFEKTRTILNQYIGFLSTNALWKCQLSIDMTKRNGDQSDVLVETKAK